MSTDLADSSGYDTVFVYSSGALAMLELEGHADQIMT